MKRGRGFTIGICLLSCNGLAVLAKAAANPPLGSDSESATVEKSEDEYCAIHYRNSGKNFRGFKVPIWVRFEIPSGAYRYTYEGRDSFPGRETCHLIIDARRDAECGPEIFGVAYQGRYRDADGSTSIGAGGGLDPIDLIIPHYAVPLLTGSGMMIKSKPGALGILNFNIQYKFFGESLASLNGFEHFVPVFPLSWEKFTCSELHLVSQEPIDVNPYQGIPSEPEGIDRP